MDEQRAAESSIKRGIDANVSGGEKERTRGGEKDARVPGTMPDQIVQQSGMKRLEVE